MTTKKKSPKKTPKKKERRGRPRANIQEYYERIYPYLSAGWSVDAACHETGVPPQTISDHMKKDEKFSERIKFARMSLELKARSNVALAIQNQKPFWVSTWYLERKCNKEFSTRIENINTNEGGEVVIVQLPPNGRETPTPKKPKKTKK